MSKMIQIRDVPDDVHRILRGRAATEGMTLSDLIKRELRQIAQRPSLKEWLEQTSQARPIRTQQSAAEVIRKLRDSR